MAKKSLAEEIAELSKPVNADLDIEDSERGVFDHRDEDEESGSDDGSDEEEQTKHYVKVGKSKLRDNGIIIKDKKYTGVASSRKDIYGSDSEVSDEEDFEDASDDEEEESEASGSEEDEEVDAEESDSGVSLKTDSEDEDESEESEPETDEEQVVDKRAKLKALMAAERKNIVSRISTSTQLDALKGYAVIKQQSFFDSILDSRIKFQKAVLNSNLLPLNNEGFEEFQESKSESNLEKIESSLHTLLNDIISLRTTLSNNNKITKTPLTFNKSKKRSLSQYLKETNQLDESLSSFKNSVLTKWSHKVQSASGASALNSTKFKAINQSAAQQVEANLLDMDRLIKRTRLNRRNVTPLGYVEESNESKNDDEYQHPSKRDRSINENENIFDDEDFYKVLLNDLIDKKMSDSNPVNGLTIQLTRTKIKKNVDTKATKGRKLNYSVQDPIQNYEAPNGKFKWNDEQIDEFFAGLLGRKVDFNESDSDMEGDNNSDDEDLQNDDIQIFG